MTGNEGEALDSEGAAAPSSAVTESNLYRDIHEGPHLSPPPVVYPPLCIWHMVLWRESKFATNRADVIEYRRKRLFPIDKFLRELFQRLWVDPDTGECATYGVTQFEADNYKSENQTLHLFGSIVETPLTTSKVRKLPEDGILGLRGPKEVVVYRVTWLDVAVTLRFEINTEYATFTAHADFSATGRAEKFPLDVSEGTNQFERRARRDLNKIVGAIRRLDIHVASGADDGELCKTLFDTLYRAPRQLIMDYVLQEPATITSKFGVVIADFRGLVLCCPESLRGNKSRIIQTASWRKSGGGRPAESVPGRGADIWKEYLRKFWPFLAAQAADDVELKKHEFTVSRMLGSRALVATTLGVQPANTNRTSPLFYFVLSNINDGRQIGRLVDRLTQMGTARVAALVGLSNLRAAGRLLKAAENLVRDAFREIFSIPTQTLVNKLGKPFDALDADEKDGIIAQERAKILGPRLTEIGIQMHEVSKVFSDDAKKREVREQRDDLEHRIERARYYVQKFRSGVPALRIARLEGYLPYHTFVERRLGNAYEFMDLLWGRFQRARADISTLNQMNMAQRSQLAQMQSSNTQREIERLQKTADLALWRALLPYYIGHIFIVGIFGLEGRFAERLWAITWAICFFYSVGRNRQQVHYAVARSNVYWRYYRLHVPYWQRAIDAIWLMITTLIALVSWSYLS